MNSVPNLWRSLFVIGLTIIPTISAFPNRRLFPRDDEDPPVLSCKASCDFIDCSNRCSVPASSLLVRDLAAEANVSSIDERSVGLENNLVKRVFRLSNQGGFLPDNEYTQELVNDYVRQQWASRGTYDNQYNGQRNRWGGNMPVLFYEGPDAPPLEGGGRGDERAMSQQFPFFQNGAAVPAFQIGQGGIHGCSIVTVISRRGVWMAHFWESYTNGKPNRDSTRGGSITAFNERFLDFLSGTAVDPATAAPGVFTEAYGRNPTTNHPYLLPDGPPIDVNLFNQPGDNTQAFIFTPAYDTVTEKQLAEIPDVPDNEKQNKLYTYGTRSLLVKDRLLQVLGAGAQVVRIPYVRLSAEESDAAPTSARGIVLFQFDPNADGNGSPRWRLFHEARWTHGQA